MILHVPWPAQISEYNLSFLVSSPLYRDTVYRAFFIGREVQLIAICVDSNAIYWSTVMMVELLYAAATEVSLVDGTPENILDFGEFYVKLQLIKEYTFNSRSKTI